MRLLSVFLSLLALQAAGFLEGARAASGDGSVVVQDQAGREVRLMAAAGRIVSLAPHATELLFAAGAGDQVVGVVEYSHYPEAARTLPSVGSYASIDLEAVVALRPDLVVGWESGNRSAHWSKLEALGIPVYLSEPRSLEAVAESIAALGLLAGTQVTAQAAADAFRARYQRLKSRYADRPKVSVFYQIWHQPLMTVNDDHLISAVIRLCGGENVFGALPQITPQLNIEGVLSAQPEVIVASGMGEARPDWVDDWRKWPGLLASARDNLFYIHPDLIQRQSPRILDGAEQLCGFLELARSRR